MSCLVQLKIARDAPRLLGFAILGLDDPSPGRPIHIAISVAWALGGEVVLSVFI